MISYSVKEKNKETSIGPTVKIRNPIIQGVIKAYAQSDSRRARLKRGGLRVDCIIFSLYKSSRHLHLVQVSGRCFRYIYGCAAQYSSRIFCTSALASVSTFVASFSSPE